MSDVSTPHIKAPKGAFADTVIMPGDPLRSKYIAENFLSGAELVNNVRGIQGYTGYYKDKRVSVMASGMGMPSMGIYSYELMKFYDVKNIIRTGSCGAIADLKIRDIVLAQAACTNSNYGAQYRLPGILAPIADYGLLSETVNIAKKMKLNYRVGNIFSSDTFYDDAESLIEWRKTGVLAVEMEAAALYMNALRLGKRALAICTVSDCPFTGESSSSDERETSFTDMMRLALELALRI
ncbi:MAG: purine-nucleoside phosphorylase [Christensenellales bacterium]|jgi:purine-nucleoside phosphorylase